MSDFEITYKVDCFPASENYWVFKVINDAIWLVLSPEAYNVDTGEIEYFQLLFDDPVTAEIMVDFLNGAEKNNIKECD